MKTEKQKYIYYDLSLIDQYPDLTAIDLLIYCRIKGFAETYGKYTLPLSDLAKSIRSSEQTARRTLRKLVEKGLLQENQENGKATEYRPLTKCNPLQNVTPYNLEAHPLQNVTPIINKNKINNIERDNIEPTAKIENELSSQQPTFAAKSESTQQAVQPSACTPSNKKPTADLSFVEPTMMPIFQEWLAYKRERHETYKTLRSLKACYKRLTELADNDPATAEKIIQQSIANNWAGLFALKNETQYANNPRTNRYAANAAAAAQPSTAQAKPYSRIQQLGRTRFNLEEL